MLTHIAHTWSTLLLLHAIELAIVPLWPTGRSGVHAAAVASLGRRSSAVGGSVHGLRPA